MVRQQLLSRRVSRFVRGLGLLKEGELLVVGVSGGPDSVCLLHILANLKKKLGIKLHIAHLNHMLRGAESDDDADYVSALARALSIPATTERRDIRIYQKEHRLSLEEAAREVRYAFFAEVARALGTDMVAVGHTVDDQIETILMHLLRGTGLAGLRGMQPVSVVRLRGAELRVIRPLLEVRKADTEAYCVEHSLSPRQDSSNLVPNQLRNRVRVQLLPLLREYNPDIDDSLLRLARAADVELAYIEAEVFKLWDSVAREQPDGIAIDKASFALLQPVLKTHFIRSAMRRLLGDLKDIESVHIESVVEALAKPAGRRLHLTRGLAFHGYYDHGLLTTNEAVFCPYPPLEGEHPLNIHGETELGGWMVKAAMLNHIPKMGREGKFEACFDYDAIGGELTVRGRRRGDRFQPLGMGSLKKLQDFMVDARIPRAWRDSVPLVCSPQHIIWVAGYRIDHRARVTPSTRRVLCLEFERV